MDNKQKSSESFSCTGVNGDSEGEEQDEPSSSSNQPSQSSVEDELATFRARWQKELLAQPPVKEQLPTKQPVLKSKISCEDGSEESTARAYFLKGAELEKTGKLYEAIQFYRKAIQIVPDIEFKLDYRPKPSFNETKTKNFQETDETDSSDDSDNDEPIEDGQLFSRIQKKISKVGYLCTPKFDQNTTHISALPLELLLHILKWVVSSDLDLRSHEMFGSVCRGFYLCSRDPEIWRLACLRIWGLGCSVTPDDYSSWRDMFIERPRLNFNGCYISKTSYIRHGENSFQDQFYRPWHLVTYYRYLRFFPDGIVLMLTSPDEPTQCVSQMKSRNPRQPVMSGYYRLKDDMVMLIVHRTEFPKATQTTYKKNPKLREDENVDQTFRMELKIQNHKTRRHVKLVWTYYSVYTRSKQGYESSCNFDLIANRFPPLWFSRVKSYTSESDRPLN